MALRPLTVLLYMPFERIILFLLFHLRSVHLWLTNTLELTNVSSAVNFAQEIQTNTPPKKLQDNPEHVIHLIPNEFHLEQTLKC